MRSTASRTFARELKDEMRMYPSPAFPNPAPGVDVPLHPKDPVQLECILSSIETNGDLAAYRRVGRIRQWL